MDSGQTYHSCAFTALLSSVKKRDPVEAGMRPAMSIKAFASLTEVL